MSNNLLLHMKNISKVFPGVKALDGVDLKVRKGSVHALMGENGAGKSTLIKVLTGVYQEEAGEIVFDGDVVKINTPHEAQDVGISTVYQELDLIPQLSIAENIYLGREIMKKGRVDWKATEQKAHEVLHSMGLDLDVRDILSSKSTAIQQMVSLARAISVNAKLVVLDEPTSSLDTGEVQVLFKVIKNLVERGISVIFITHKLDEVFEISDEMTILKDGKLAGTSLTKDITKLEMVSLMIGRDASEVVGHKKDYSKIKISDESMIRGEDLNYKPKVIDQNIDLKKGEVLGFAGLLGSGRTELARLLFGVDIPEGGDIYVKDEKVHFKGPRDAIKRNIAFCFEDRKTEGIIPEMSVKENLTLAILPQISKMGVVSVKKQDEIVDKFIKALNIKLANPNQPIKSLSGGNQQKVLLAKALATNPELLILDEPTRGIDVGAKREILDITEGLSEQGISIIIISSELEELVSSCTRINVLRDGTKVGEMSAQEISEAAIMNYIAGEDDKEEQ